MLVNFLIIGAQKAGTSALAKFISQHPEVYMGTRKEVHFFNHPDKFQHLSREQMIELYHSNFPDPGNSTNIGEATPAYMFLPFVPKLIFNYNQNMKIICILRNPIERAWSQYVMEKNRGFEKKKFWRSIFAENIKYLNDRNNFTLVNKNDPVRRFCYLERGLYSQQINRWMNYFPKSNILILKTQDLLADHAATMLRVYGFLNIKNRDFIPKQEIVFKSKENLKIDIFSKMLLQIYFIPERRRLRKMYNINL